MRPVVRAAAFAALVVACAPFLRAQEPPTPAAAPAAAPAVDRSTPESLFASTTAAMRRGDWQGIAQTMDPQALESMRGLMLRLAAADPSGEAGSAFFGTADPERLAALSGPELFGRFMRSAVEFVPQLGAFLAATRSDLLGSVKEGELLHLVYRSTFSFGEGDVSSVEVMTVTKKGEAWYTTLHGDFEPIIQAFVDQVESSAPPAEEATEQKE